MSYKNNDDEWIDIDELAEKMHINCPAVRVCAEGAKLAKKGKFKEAMTYFQKAIELRQDYADAHYNLALTFEALGQEENAQKEYEDFLKLNPNDAPALSRLAGILLNKDQLEQGKKLLDRALEIDDKSAITHANLVLYYMKTGDMYKMNEHAKMAQRFYKSSRESS